MDLRYTCTKNRPLKRAIQGTFQPNFLSNGSVVSEEDKVFFT